VAEVGRRINMKEAFTGQELDALKAMAQKHIKDSTPRLIDQVNDAMGKWMAEHRTPPNTIRMNRGLAHQMSLEWGKGASVLTIETPWGSLHVVEDDRILNSTIMLSLDYVYAIDMPREESDGA
jgi:hypothetical protein